MITLIIAVWGAITGTLGTVVSLASRRDAVWARRARALRARDDVTAIREVLAEAKADPTRAAVLTSHNTFRAHVQAVEDEVGRCPDRKLRKQLGRVGTRCLSLTNSAASADGTVSYNVSHGIEEAMDATVVVLERFDELDRRAPTD